MEQPNSFADRMNERIARLPAELQALWKDFFRGIETGNSKKTELACDKMRSSDWFAATGDRATAVVVGQMLFLSLKEAYAAPKTAEFEVFTAILPVFSEFLCKHGKNPDLKDHPKLLLTLGEQFAVAFYDGKLRSSVNFDNFYEFHLQHVRDYLASPGFKGWRTLDGSDEFLKACLGRWLVHMGNFSRNRREKPFLNLLDLSLLLLRTVPEFLPAFQGLPLILPAAKKAFHFSFAGGEDGVQKILTRARQAANPELKSVIGEWLDIYTIGALPEVPRAGGEFEESPELTVPFVYRSLLEEVLGDGSISADEEWVIKNMRDFLEISPGHYERIFAQVQEARSLQKIKLLDRDFSPREFLRKILLKTIEDGVVTDEEKNIVGKTANALLLNQQTLTEVFQEAKAGMQAGEKASTPAVSRELTRIHELIRYTAMEERIRPVLVSDRGMKLYQKAGKVLGTLRQKAREQAGDKASDLLGEWPVAAFYFEPQTYLYPVLMLFVDSPNVQPARLEFKGGRIDVEFLENVKSRAGEDAWVDDRPLLRIYNDAMELEIPIKGCAVGESLQIFLAGLEETRGKYSLMMMHHGKMAPILALQKSGYIDSSGNLAQARRLLNDGKFTDAATLLDMINKGFPEMHEVLYHIGLCYERLAETSPDAAALLEKARASFAAELELNPQSDKSLRAQGRLCTRARQWDAAAGWFKKALEIAPASIPTLTLMAEVAWQQALAAGAPERQLPDDVARYLGEAYQIFPTHPRVVKLLDSVSKQFQVDPAALFRSMPVSTFYQ